MPETVAPAKPVRAWLPWALLILWLGWIAFLAWTSHPYWGAPRTGTASDGRTEAPSP